MSRVTWISFLSPCSHSLGHLRVMGGVEEAERIGWCEAWRGLEREKRSLRSGGSIEGLCQKDARPNCERRKLGCKSARRIQDSLF